ncbi:MAG: GTP-binding protein [Candidatus Methylophosphatis roskildensis]
MEPIPVTILTGFLGSGKTTLLNRILREFHGRRIAVIENEFGAEGIDNELLVEDREEQIVEMNNGCICCTVRGDLVRILGDLAQRRHSGELAFERVIIETTGLADPAPVAQTFFVDEAIHEQYLLDAIVTVVDAHHAPQQLDEHHEAQEQVGFADRLLLSKTDLVSEDAVRDLEGRLRRMNPRAPLFRVHFGDTPIEEILDIRGFNLDTILEIDPEFLDDVGHEHDDDVGSFVFRADRPFDQAKLEAFLGGIVQVYGTDMLRYKGVLWIADVEQRAVLQGVHMIMGANLSRPWKAGEKRESVLVFIGRRLPQDVLERGLMQCLTDVSR